MLVLAYLGVGVQNFTQLGGLLIFTFFYLKSRTRIWPVASSVSTSGRIFVRSPLTLQASCSGYCDILQWLGKNVQGLLPELWWQKNWLLHQNALFHTSFFTRELFLSKTTWLSSPTHPTFLYPQLKIILKGHHFDTTEVIYTESQVVLNTHTEHDFQDAFKKNGRSAGNSAYVQKGTTSRLWWPVGTKLVFDQMAEPFPVIMDTLFYIHKSGSA
jgi:hypothetical protein